MSTTDLFRPIRLARPTLLAGRLPRALVLTLMAAPALVYLLVTTQVPFVETVYYSLYRWRLNVPGRYRFIGLGNYINLFDDPRLFPVFRNTVSLTCMVVLVTMIAGCAMALLLNRKFIGRGVVRTMIISPFLVMPIVTAVTWKNMLLDPVYGLANVLLMAAGFHRIDFLVQYPMSSIIAMVAWEWTPFATLVLLTGLQSLPDDQVEAARLDGAGPWAVFRYVTAPHLRQFLRVIVTMETIFIIQVFGEIYTATGGGPGTATSTIPYLLYSKAFLEYDIGLASAAGVVSVVAVNLIAAVMMKLVEGRG